MLIDIWDMKPESFSSFGKVLGKRSLQTVPHGEEFTWAVVSDDLPLASPSCTGHLVCRPRERVVRKLERHENTTEIMIALKGDSVICVAPSGLDKPEGSDLCSFKVKEGTAFMMNRSVWHWIPFPLQDEDSQFLVLFRDGTGDGDLHFHELEQAVRF